MATLNDDMPTGSLKEQLCFLLRISNEILNKKSLNKQDKQNLQDVIDYLCTEYVGTEAALKYLHDEFIKTVGEYAYQCICPSSTYYSKISSAQSGLMLDDSSDEV